ncbi:hypothetical protein CB0940_01846 [Cercospora beticola]|uniref:Protein kinase domain-containing protein n=1 Tax=Cercospora beticola TaxID=122368 RepID=A0A2G5I9A5_CERBT|nr:hypothetical protein CB0940_01846 [Cercospora beticola]PIB01350.1 hypothetical protein CB0940_01846 [Cercospora beticola]WPA97300.1 hypothetical protein RHO25_001909 [Cercospora beticola]CAK1354283.1 unnamed protein product [Cercospora beticola]
MSSTISKVVQVPKELIGATGHRYHFKELLHHKPRLGSIWVATHGREKFVLKDIPQNIFSNFNVRIWPRLRENPSPKIRLPIDTIPGRRTYVYQYLQSDLFSLVKDNISMRARRQILKRTLQAIADLHYQDVVHLDMKPDNIMVNCRRDGDVTTVDKVMLIDLENAAHLPSGRCVKGMLAGNDNWRSPEAHFKSELSKPSDVFSFGLICVYAIFGRVICGVDEDFQKHESQGAVPMAIRLQRLVSYFGDEEGLNGLMRHVGDDDTNCQILSMLWEERNAEYIGYRPFSEWPEDQEDGLFRDLFKGLMNLDPGKRITAAQALGHPWFAEEGI